MNCLLLPRRKLLTGAAALGTYAALGRPARAAAWTLVAHTTTFEVDNTPPFSTTGINTTGADLLLIAFATYAGFPPTITDTYSNTWTLALSASNSGSSNPMGSLYYSASPTVGTGHVFTFNDCYSTTVAVQAWNGAAASGVLDQTNSNDAIIGETTFQPGSITPSKAGALVVTSMATIDNVQPGGPYSINDSFTISDQYGDNSGAANGYGIAFAYLAQSTAEAVNPTWTDAVQSDNGVALIASFLPGASGGGTHLNLPLLKAG